VETVVDEMTILDKFYKLLDGARNAVVVIALILIVAAVLLVANTIRLSAFNRRRETSIMRLVGATESVIRWPRLLQGMAQGLLAAIVALATLEIAYAVAVPRLEPLLPVTIGLERVTFLSPLQALARLHVLAAADQVDNDRLGRPRADAEIGPRLELLGELVTGRTSAPAPVVAAVAHGELLTLKPFGSADGVVARAVSRLVTIASGLDPHGLGVPEVSWMRQPADYRDAARGFADGTPDGVGAWLVLCCRALQAGAQEAFAIAESLPNR